MEKNNEIPVRGTVPSISEGIHKVVETYAEDMAKVIEGGQGGIIKNIIHSEEESELEKNNLSPESKKNKWFMFLGMLFVVLSAAALVFLFLKKATPSIPAEKQFTPIIFTDRSALIEVADLKKDEIADKVLAEVNTTKVKQGGVEGIYLTFTKAPVGLRKFIEISKSAFVPDDKFVDDNFLLGVVKEENPDFFILIKVRSIPDVFEAMKTWENKIFIDLHGYFGIDISPDTKYLLTANFEDGIIQNKNARILYKKDAEGKKQIAVAYIFVDDTTVIITNTEDAARELMLRLASSEVKK